MGGRTRRVELVAAYPKFILSHPAVTVAIPATTRVDHVRENLSAAAGPMPDLAMRERISAHVRGSLMSEWWTYRPEDFLLFSPRVYWRMFELHNAALWPLQLLVACRRSRHHPARSSGSLRGGREALHGGSHFSSQFCGSSSDGRSCGTAMRPSTGLPPTSRRPSLLKGCCSSFAELCSTGSPSTGAGPPAGSDISSLPLHSPDSRCSRRYRDVAGPRPRFLASRRIRLLSRRSASCFSLAAGSCHCSCQSPFSGAS